MTYGIKVSKSGKDISSTTPTDFVMKSEWATIKILKEGSGSKVVGASSSVTETVTHSAGFSPLVLLFVELTPSSGRWYVAPFYYSGGPFYTTENTYIDSSWSDTYTTDSAFQFKIVNNTASQKTISYYYYVIGETGV